MSQAPPAPVHPRPPSLLGFFFGWMWDPGFRRWWGLVVPLVFLVVAGGVWGYPRMKEGQYVRMGLRAMDAKDYVTAANSARSALRLNPDNRDAVRLMVELCRLFPDAPERWQWSGRLLELEPDNRELLVENVQGFIIRKDATGARKLMDQYAPRHPNDAGILLWRGILGLLNKDPGGARKFFEQAAVLAPGNAEVRLNLAKLDLGSADPAVVRRALDVLEQWPHDDIHYAEAGGTLMTFHRDRQDSRESLRVGRRLLADSALPLDRRIRVVRMLRGMGDVPRDAWQAEWLGLMQECSDSPQKAALLMGLMLEDKAWGEVVAFRKSLPDGVRMNPLVSVPAVTAWLQLGQDPAVRELAEAPAWEGAEEIRQLIRLHYGERADRIHHYAALADQAASDPRRLVKMAALCRMWAWTAPEEVFLWKLARLFPGNGSALGDLNRLYRERRDARGMLRVARESWKRDPANFGAANNAAYLGILLNADPRKSLEIAAENHRRQPDNPAFVSTHAFALSRTGKPEEGLAMLEKLPSKILTSPEMTFCHAVLLRACGQQDKARELGRNLDKTQMLPEEIKLLD